MEIIREGYFEGERALYGSSDITVENSIFDNGESPLKESKNLILREDMFKWKYPLWYCDNVKADGCTWFEMARAGVWYSRNIEIKNALIQAPKNFRRSTDLTLEDVVFSNAEETLWTCSGVKLKNVSASGHYFAMNCENMEVDHLVLDGNYAFDGAKNAVIRNSRLMTKDAFWNCDNITVYDSFISGEYLGWNSKNLTFVNCTIESNQGMCYIDGLKLVNCKLTGTTLAFEFSNDIDAEIVSSVEQVFNPGSGKIKACKIKELIIEKDKVDQQKTSIECDNIVKTSDRPEWLR